MWSSPRPPEPASGRGPRPAAPATGTPGYESALSPIAASRGFNHVVPVELGEAAKLTPDTSVTALHIRPPR
jgi:hypothetical protein